MAGLTLPGNKPVPIDYPEKFKFTDPTKGEAQVINALLPYIFPAAGLVLLFMIIAGGFQLLTSAGNPESTAKGYKRILYAVIGFIVIFVSYWIIQIIQDIFGIDIFR